MPYSHRNLARPELEVSLDLTFDTWLKPPPPTGNTEGGGEVIFDTGKLGSTRFHITCRIMVTDRSRWMSPGKFSLMGPLNRWLVGETFLILGAVQRPDTPPALAIPVRALNST
jgi:hypothetical protein